MARMLATVAIAYVVTHLGYMIFNFYPARELGPVLGNVVELLVWLVVCAVAYLALGKFSTFRPKQT